MTATHTETTEARATDIPVVDHWLDGQAWAGTGERFGDVRDPSTGQVVARVRLASAADVEQVVQRAAAAWPAWRDTSLGARARVLFAFRDRLLAHRDELGRIASREHGKTVDDALGEVDRGLEVVEFACGIPQLLKGEYSEQVSTGVDAHTVRQPLGVVAGITPFNFPVMVPLWMYPVAIACGNAFVLKPSERDPSASQLVARLWQEAGLPDGIFSVVNGDREAVDALLEAPGLAGVSFVGSTPVARHIYATAAAAGKRVQALGGAKNHMVVLPDADINGAADAAVAAACGSAGERCMAISVVVAVGEVADPLVDAVAERMRRLRVGPGDDPATDMGPLITREHRDRVAGYVDSGAGDGARVVVDGRHDVPLPDGEGFYLGPCLLDEVTPSMSVYRDEVFGPVLSVVRVDDLDAALDLVASNPYGNGVAVFTGNGGAAHRFVRDVEAGMVGVNVPIPVPMAYHSFGGWGASLFGDIHVHGPDGVRFYTRAKAVTSRWPGSSTVHHPPSMSFPTTR